jgi:hypothetical protein
MLVKKLIFLNEPPAASSCDFAQIRARTCYW